MKTLGFVKTNDEEYKISTTRENREVPEEIRTGPENSLIVYHQKEPGESNHVETIDLDSKSAESNEEIWEVGKESVEFHADSKITAERKKF